MTNVSIFSVALVALLLSALPALVYKCHWQEIRRAMRNPLSMLDELLMGEAGVVVVTYAFPVSGVTAPTAVQASQVPTQTAQVFFADTDTQAVVTHNWGLPASFPGFLFPECIMTKSLGGGSDSSFATGFTFGLTNTNSITINKLSIGTGSGGTYNLVLRKPHSVGL